MPGLPSADRRSSSPHVPLPLNSASISAQSVATPSSGEDLSSPRPGKLLHRAAQRFEFRGRPLSKIAVRTDREDPRHGDHASPALTLGSVGTAPEPQQRATFVVHRDVAGVSIAGDRARRERWGRIAFWRCQDRRSSTRRRDWARRSSPICRPAGRGWDTRNCARPGPASGRSRRGVSIRSSRLCRTIELHLRASRAVPPPQTI